MRTSKKTTSIQDKFKHNKESKSLFSKSAICEQSSEPIQLFKLTMWKLNREQIIKAIQTHRWRASTYLPIIKTISYTVAPDLTSKDNMQLFHSTGSAVNYPNKAKDDANSNLKIIQYVQEHLQVTFYRLAIKIQAVICRLSEMAMLPFSQSVYLLKEMLIGFQVLVDMFGFFDPTERMVAVNDQGHWKMWINQNYCIDQKQQAQISEKKFIQKLILMSERHCIFTTQSKLFFGMMKKISQPNECKFVKMLEKVSDFVLVNKIYLVSKVTLPPKESSKLKNCQKSQKKVGVKESKHKKTLSSVKNIKTCQKNQFCEINNEVELSNPIIVNDKNCFNNSYNTQNNFNNTIEENTVKKSKNISEIFKKCIWKPKSADYGMASPNQTNKLKTDIKQSEQSQSNSSNNYIQSNKNNVLNVSFMRNNAPLQIPKIKQLTKNISHSHLDTNQFTGNHEYKHYISNKNRIVKPFQRPFKKQKDRKYSEQIGTINIEHLSKINRQKNQSSHNLSYKSFQFKKNNNKKEQNPTNLIAECNSSGESTKKLLNSEDIKKSHKASYWRLKVKDIDEKQQANNQSLIKSQTWNQNILKTHKTPNNNQLTVSFEFDDRAHHNPQNIQSQQQRNQFTGSENWTDKILGLFNQNSSICHLTKSIECKSPQEQFFEKQYLKDVKLDMLQKFGRNANLSLVRQTSQSQTEEGQKSMTLIMEEQQESKQLIYDDQDQKNNLNIKVRRQRDLIVQPIVNHKESFLLPKQVSIRQYHVYKGKIDLKIISNNDGFDFESQQHVVKPSYSQ